VCRFLKRLLASRNTYPASWAHPETIPSFVPRDRGVGSRSAAQSVFQHVSRAVGYPAAQVIAVQPVSVVVPHVHDIQRFYPRVTGYTLVNEYGFCDQSGNQYLWPGGLRPQPMLREVPSSERVSLAPVSSSPLAVRRANALKAKRKAAEEKAKSELAQFEESAGGDDAVEASSSQSPSAETSQSGISSPVRRILMHVLSESDLSTTGVDKEAT